MKIETAKKESFVSRNYPNQIKNLLRKISYAGKNESFIENPITIEMYLQLLSLYEVGVNFYKATPFIRKTGYMDSALLSKNLREITYRAARKALFRQRKTIDPAFKCIDFSLLINGESGFVTGNPEVDIEFWKMSSTMLTIEIEGKTKIFPRIGVFNEIQKLEKKLRIKGSHKLSFTQLPTGYILAEGNLSYGDWNSMRAIGKKVKEKCPYIELSSAELCWNGGGISSKVHNKVLNVPLRAKINPRDIKYIYGECTYQVIADPEHNLTFFMITNPRGRRITLYHYQQVIKDLDLYLEVDFTSKFESFYGNPSIIGIIDSETTQINGLPEGNDFDIPEIQTVPLKSKENVIISTEKRNNTKPRLIKQMVTPQDKNGCCPTLLASHNKPTQFNMLSTGHRPNPGVLEIWETKDSHFKHKLTVFEKIAQGNYLVRRKYEGYNPSYTKDLDFFQGRKISNSTMMEILKTIQEMKRNQYVKLRSLTPREKFRLMGMKEEDIKKLLKSGLSIRKLSRLAGDSVVVNVWMAIMTQILLQESQEKNARMAA